VGFVGWGRAATVSPSSDPGAVARELQELEDLAVDGGGEEDLGDLVLTSRVDSQVIAGLFREAEQIGAGDTILEILDLVLDPCIVDLPK
jgi:hypothetical protein